MFRVSLISCFIVFVLINIRLTAQEHQCGVTLHDQNQWMDLYQEELRSKSGFSKRTNDIISIPITLHLVARNNGVGRVKIQTALEVLCELNDLFLASNIEFHLTNSGVSLANHDGIFNNSDFTINKLAMQSLKNPKAINVFVVNSITGNNVVALYDYENDWIVMQKNAFVPENKTLAHEIGHFFSLFHPHFGWDTQAWDPNVHGSPVAEISPDGVTPTELANRDNCTVAGDKLCDTAPDYNFGIFWQGDCDYGEVVYDANGDQVDPDESLIMSYFGDECRGRFSEEQINIMHENINHDSRTFLDTFVNKPVDTIFNDVVQLSPVGSVSKIADSLFFEWSQPSNGEHFYIEYDRSPTFSLDPKGQLVDTNFIWLNNNWLLNTTYYWRVLTWNNSYFCHENGKFEQFSLDVSALGQHEVNENIQVRFLENQIVIQYDIEDDKDVDLSFYKIDGQRVFRQKVRLNNAVHEISIDRFDASNELILVSMSEKGKIIHQSLVSNF